MKKLKKQLHNVFYLIAKNNFISVFCAAIVVIIFVISTHGNKEWFDITFFSSLVGAMILEVIAQVVSKALMNRLEDEAKLTTEYDDLVKRYTQQFFVYDNSNASTDNKRKLNKAYKKKEDKNIFDFPIECVGYLDNCNITIKDRAKMYKLPEVIKEHYDEIFASHKTSTLFNQLNIRVKDWKIENNQLMMKTSRTTYFDSMVTNRAMDYKWSNGLSVRDALGYGPIWPTLEESGLSNHLGFNGFVESSDGYIVFVKRGNKLSIGKRTYATSIGASMKAKYALTDGVFDNKGLRTAIIREINDELKITEDELEDFQLHSNMISAYRDVVEGGKPQLLFYAKSNKSKDDIETDFKNRSKEASKSFKILEDGTKFLWIKEDELKDLCITSDMIIHNGKIYKMVPSASASVAMFINFVTNRNKEIHIEKR